MCLHFLGYDCIANRCVGSPNHFHDFWCQWFSISRSWWYPCKLCTCLPSLINIYFGICYWLAGFVLIFIYIFHLIAQNGILWVPSCFFNGFVVLVAFAILLWIDTLSLFSLKNTLFCLWYKLSVLKSCLFICLGSYSFIFGFFFFWNEEFIL